MIRAVFDTNTVVSGFLWSGAPAKAIFAAIEGKFQLLATEALIAELERVLSRKKFASRFAAIGKTPQGFLANYRAPAELVQPAEIALVVATDPTDNAVLACAVGGKADYVVSGDTHLLNLASYQNISILTVNRFLTFLEEHQPE
jgi:putative PIN family toxin of toxin-antitoxin system